MSINEQLLTTDEVLSLADPRGSTLARDRCQPVGVDRPARPVSTAKRDANDPDDGGAEDDGKAPQTFETSSATTRVSSGAEEVEPHPTNRGGSEADPPRRDSPQSQSEASDRTDHDEKAESGDDDGDTKIVLRDGEFVEIPAEDGA